MVTPPKEINLEKVLRVVPDFPKPGIMFRDITTLAKDPEAFSYSIDLFAEHYKDLKVDAFAGLESRGFVFGSALAYKLKKGFILIRKSGKLPYKTIKEEYDLEYGKSCLEISVDALSKGMNIAIIDDLIATGGSLLASIKLIEKLEGNIVDCGCLIELVALKGREKIEKNGKKLFSILKV